MAWAIPVAILGSSLISGLLSSMSSKGGGGAGGGQSVTGTPQFKMPDLYKGSTALMGKQQQPKLSEILEGQASPQSQPPQKGMGEDYLTMMMQQKQLGGLMGG